MREFQVSRTGAVRIAERDVDHNQLAKMWLTGFDGTTGGVVTQEEAYARQSWVYACVTAIARTASSVPLRIRSGRNRIVGRGPAYELFRRPTLRQTSRDLIYVTLQHLELAGNSLWLKDVSDMSQRPIGLKPLNPHRIKPVVRNEELLGYVYTKRIGDTYVKVPLPLDRVIHFQYPNPNNPFWGQAPLEAAMDGVNTDVKAATYNQKFFDNSAQPGGLLIHKRSISKIQQEQVRQAFQQEHGGADKSHRLAVLAGDWDYKQLGLGQKDMEFLDQRRFSREQIGAVFGVPSVLMNDPNNSNYSTASVELRIFAESNWLPKLRALEEVINTQIFMPNWPEMFLEFDVKEAPGLREDLGEKIIRAEKLFKMGVPLNDIILLLDLPIEEKPWGNDWWVPTSIVPATATMDNGPPQIDVTPASDKATQIAPTKNEWREVADIVRPLEIEFSRRLTGFLTGLRSACTSACHTLSLQPFPLGEYNTKLATAVNESTLRAYRLGIESVGGNAANQFSPPIVGILDLPAALYETLSGIEVQERERVVRSLFDDLRSKSKILSRTQITAALHLGRLAGMEQRELHKHAWVCAETHEGYCCAANSGAVVDLRAAFPNGCMYPLDPAASKNSLCRCTTVPVS